MGNSTSCTNANNDNLTGITLNEHTNKVTGRTKSVFTFPKYDGCRGSRILEINTSKDGNDVTITNIGSDINILGFKTNNIISNNYVKKDQTIQKFTNSESDNNICLHYNIIISLIIILLVIYYLNHSKI
jgi:hypothetical protein